MQRPARPFLLRPAPVTWILAAVNVLVFALVLARGAPDDPELLVGLGALERSRVWAGEPWRLVTAGFLHGSPRHLVMNLGALLLAGPLVERDLGSWRYLALFLASLLGASATSLLAHDAVVVGASGGVFGTVSALLVLEARRAGTLRRFLAASPTVIVLGALVLGFAVSRVSAAGLPSDDFAHAGGLVTGAAAAWLLARRPGSPRWPWAALGVALAALVVAASWPRSGTTQFQAATIERGVHEALRREDAGEARRLLADAAARGLRSPALDYYGALVRAHDGDLEGALQALREIASGAGPSLRDDARRSAARVARMLGYRHASGDGRPLDRPRALAYLEESCALGEERSCREAAALRTAIR